MKFQLQSLGYLFIAGLLGFTSCKKDEDSTPAPTITIKSNGLGGDQAKGNAAAGQSINFTFEANASEKLKSIEIYQTIGSSETKIQTIDSDFDTDTKSTETYDYAVPATATGAITLKFAVTDKSNGKASSSFVITITASDFNTYSAKLLAAPLDNGTSQSFFTSVDGGTHNLSVAKANSSKVDFGYYYGATLGAAFASPGDYPTFIDDVFPTGEKVSTWSSKNVTEFRKISTDVFSSLASSASIGTAFEDGTPTDDGIAGSSPKSGRITGLAVNQQVGFKTVSGKKGILKVTAIVTGTGSTGQIKFDVKVQK